MSCQPGDGFRASRLLAQTELLDLSGRSLGKICEHDAARTLEVGQAFPAELEDLLFGRRRNAGSQFNEYAGDFAPLPVWLSDHGGVQHRRMSVNYVLDFDG